MGEAAVKLTTLLQAVGEGTGGTAGQAIARLIATGQGSGEGTATAVIKATAAAMGVGIGTATAVVRARTAGRWWVRRRHRQRGVPDVCRGR
ncbi:hypothetical protein H7H37_08260 [Mycolicibacterium insubricum]|nr:hypothetical protein [Mycolicibacterium insubricum]